MKKPESGNPSEEGFDAGVDFFEFLEAAKKHATQSKLDYLPPSPTEAKKNFGVTNEVEGKKSWKKSLFFWSKSKKNVKSQHKSPSTESSKVAPVRNFRRTVLSGPIICCGDRVGPPLRISRPTSGPLASFFAPTRKEEFEAPYMCLEQINHPTNGKAFGPIYLVT